MASVIGHSLSRRELDEWAGRIVRRGEDYTVQAYRPLSEGACEFAKAVK